MRAYRFLHQIAVRFSAMDESEAQDLNTEAQTAYNDLLFTAKNKEAAVDAAEAANLAGASIPGYKPVPVPSLKPKERLILSAETWYSRYAFALGFIAVVPMLNRVMNGDEEEEQNEQDEAMKFAQAYTMFSRNKKSR